MDSARKIVATASGRYEQLIESSSIYKLVFDKYLSEFVVRRDALLGVRLFFITDPERAGQFQETVMQMSNGSQLGAKTTFLFHGPNFQEDKCQFNFNTDMCNGHENNIMCLTDNLLYTYRNQGERTRNTSVGYVLLCGLFIGKVLKRDPEDMRPIRDYFDSSYDTVLDYGNKKCFKKISNQIWPCFLIEYHRKFNSRLDNPLDQIFKSELINPAPEVTYEKVDPSSPEFTFLCNYFPCIKILSVTKSINPYIEKKFNEVKEKYYPNSGNCKTVFHSTTFECVDLIAKYNLDWRKCTYGLYGWGVHFAGFASYATIFPLKNLGETLFNGPKKCMIMFNMLYDEQRLYQIKKENYKEIRGMEQPPQGYNGIHLDFAKYVKFNDNEFMPVYKIVYEQS